jgi:transposase
MRFLMVVKQQRGRNSNYADEFKQRLVAESRAAGVSVPMVSKRHGVPTSRIYSWRGDARFQPDGSEAAGFMPVEISVRDCDAAPSVPEAKPPHAAQIEIALENGRKLVVSDGVDWGFVLELARGLVA